MQDSEDNDEGRLYYDDKQNFITISGILSWKMADSFFNKLSDFEIRDPKKPVKVYINSEGGEISAMFKIYDHIRHSPCPLVTIGSGLVFSGAIIVFLAGDLRWAFPNVAFGFHWPIRKTESNENPDEAKEAVRSQNNYFERVMDIAEDRTKISDRRTLRELFRIAKRFNAETAIKYGVAHQILEPAKKQLPKNWQKFIKP